MNEDWHLSRGVSVELTSEKMMRHELVPLIQHALSQLPEKYSVHLEHNIPDLEPVFILVETDKVLVDGSYLSLMERFGLLAD